MRWHDAWAALTAAVLGGGACAGAAGPRAAAPKPVAQVPQAQPGAAQPQQEPPSKPEAAKQQPPPSGPRRPVRLPARHRSELPNGLRVVVVRWDAVPIAYAQLLVLSGAETDPPELPGLAHFVASMLEEGTRRRSAEQLAEAVEFYGADLWTGSDEENLWVAVRTPTEHLQALLELLAEVALQPAFRAIELRKFKARELDRLKLQRQNPRFLARRELYGRLYGEHPYGRIDTTPEAVRKVRVQDLKAWHRRHVVPGNAILLVVGDVQPEQVRRLAQRAFGRWRRRPVPQPSLPRPPERQRREVVVVDRPDSVQSVVAIGNLALRRASEDWVPLAVANQVLGGSAASRLFMDLRERRSLTYGAYSVVGERVDVAPFVASASVRTEVTAQAVEAFFEHLERIVREPPTADELEAAQRYLSDSFPLQIETPREILRLVADLYVYGLPEDYWERYRQAIAQVTAEQALQAARRYILPDRALVVVVGEAAEVAGALRRWGPVTVVDVDGKVVSRLQELSEPQEAQQGS